MIVDQLSQFPLYSSLHPLFPSLCDFIADPQILSQLPLGKQERNQGIYFIVSEYKSKNKKDGITECHRQYIDIQIVLEGQEQIGFCTKTECQEGAYDDTKDFQPLWGPVTFLPLKPGAFMIFFPHDGHMPGLSLHSSKKIKKLVIKVPFQFLFSG